MPGDLQELDSLRLVTLCAQSTQNSAVWSEFVRRFTPKIKQFIRGTLRQSAACGSPVGEAHICISGVQENDLFQNTIIRLVANDCAALKRFTGTSENDFLAYLAVISRSVVRDFLRSQNAAKRPKMPVLHPRADSESEPMYPDANTGRPQLERRILAHEVVGLSRRAIQLLSGVSAERNWLIFQLYYYYNLSAGQISQCKGIDLSKAGVEKVLNQVKERVRTIISTDPSEAVI